MIEHIERPVMIKKILILSLFSIAIVKASAPPQGQEQYSRLWFSIRTIDDLHDFLTPEDIRFNDWKDVIDNEGNTLLHKLTENGPLPAPAYQVIENLIRNDAQIDIPNHRGETVQDRVNNRNLQLGDVRNLLVQLYWSGEAPQRPGLHSPQEPENAEEIPQEEQLEDNAHENRSSASNENKAGWFNGNKKWIALCFGAGIACVSVYLYARKTEDNKPPKKANDSKKLS
jgi:hypothetical protein